MRKQIQVWEIQYAYFENPMTGFQFKILLQIQKEVSTKTEETELCQHQARARSGEEKEREGEYVFTGS